MLTVRAFSIALTMTCFSFVDGALGAPADLTGGVTPPVRLDTSVAKSDSGETTPSGSDVRPSKKSAPRRHGAYRAKKTRGEKSTARRITLARKNKRGLSFETTGSATTSIGYFSGVGTRRDRDAFAGASLRTVPTLKWREWQGKINAGLSYWRPLTVSLMELKGTSDAELRWHPIPALWVTGFAGLSGTYRPNWPDPYQPNADGSLATTDRFGYTERSIGLRLSVLPARRHRAKLAYEYLLSDYAQDSHFDAQLSPNHLVPGDHERHRINASWATQMGRNTLEAAGQLEYESYFFAFARDRGTGRTHANPGGLPANPLAEFWGVEPTISWQSRWFGETLSVTVSYGHEARFDRFQGYYSYQGPHPAIRTGFKAAGWETKLNLDLKWRRYGSDSYRAGAGHPPLEDGRRLYDRRLAMGATVIRALGKGLSLYAEESAVVRWSNYPDYEPGVFPATRRYDINWDYWNLKIAMGVQADF